MGAPHSTFYSVEQKMPEIFKNLAVVAVVVKWSACPPWTPMIWVRILLKHLSSAICIYYQLCCKDQNKEDGNGQTLKLIFYSRSKWTKICSEMELGHCWLVHCNKTFFEGNLGNLEGQLDLNNNKVCHLK